VTIDRIVPLPALASSLTLQFSMPLHDMFKENCGPGFGKRRVGYIMLTRRIKL
jgi:hypothetical protein